MENKIKHMEMIQNIINRMATTSFLIKGWCVTIVSALLALAAKDANTKFILISFFPVLMFWILDAYFLRQERLFRKLYNNVSKTEEGSIDFSMDTSTVAGETEPWLKVALSVTLRGHFIPGNLLARAFRRTDEIGSTSLLSSETNHDGSGVG